MKIFHKLASFAVFSAMLASSAVLMHAQDTTKKKPAKAPPGKEQAAPAQPHTAPPVQQHTPPPPVEQHTPPVTPPAQQPIPQNQPRPGVPPTPQTHQPQPNNLPPNRTTQPAPGPQPGRGFGTNPPARGMEPARGQIPMAGRPMAPPVRTVTTPRGDVIHRDASGQVRQVHMSNGTVVYHPANAPRRIEVVRPGGRVVVAGAPGHGYVQRPIVVNNVTIVKRTYIYNGVPQAVIYRPRVFNGVTLAVYTPVRYYRPTFYAYAYNPWARPIAYSWGWGGSPWYGYYGGYFTPYPVYASPSLWLTDYMIAATLNAAYQERMAAHMAPAGIYQDGGQAAPMTPEVKQAIADEVRRQIDLERASGQNPNAPGGQDSNIFADNVPHVFVVTSTLAVNSNAGDCTIAEGDVLRMNGPPPPNATAADLIVLSSRGRDCRRGSTVSVALQDLQEMHNQMLATIDRGMSDLQAKQGQGGLPTLPQGSAGTIDTPFAQEAQPDANVATELTSASQEADLAEQQAVSQGGDAGAPPTLSLGLSIDQVRAIQGEPQKVVDLGPKQIYVYKDLKITFTDGKVSDIQ
jgi:outer membrane biosynthesis protein TonB